MRGCVFGALAALALGLFAVATAEEPVSVEVTGSGTNRDAALDDALRKAVEKGAGVEVTSRTETLDHAVASPTGARSRCSWRRRAGPR
ncbi:MAG: hypothetical protein MUC63_10320 [Planctomycetes bacterium]|nr:hypothetical protein [Planctomycetota bacterium]